MKNSNSRDNKKSMWLEATDSEILHTGFADFVQNYQKSCKDEGDVEPKVKGPQSSATSCPVEHSSKSSSLKSIGPSSVSDTNRVVDDAGFNRFLDEWTARASKEARIQWTQMSKRDKAMYAPKDDLVTTPSATSGSAVSPAFKRLFFGEVSSGAIRRACDKACTNLGKRRYKPKSLQPKKCAKPRRVAKGPKAVANANTFPKPKVDKCPKPKTDRKHNKPKLFIKSESPAAPKE
ncbi:uncharacterized protein LOC110179825 [Drosophila serrata]|uniref:uncharacterized protein LOC110179825 n=1 Tax=Drosophila serrata TaxID=7274 RepID=UPI000A1D04FC|nr:uncharacterized protein LOC110179825 [Drosophila serrata]